MKKSLSLSLFLRRNFGQRRLSRGIEYIPNNKILLIYKGHVKIFLSLVNVLVYYNGKYHIIKLEQ